MHMIAMEVDVVREIAVNEKYSHTMNIIIVGM